MFIKKKSVGRRCNGQRISSFQTSKAIKRVTGGKTIIKAFQNTKRDRKGQEQHKNEKPKQKQNLRHSGVKGEEFWLPSGERLSK